MIREQFENGKPLQQWRQDLLAAAQYIREHGWCQGTHHRDSGEVCIVGAIDAVTDYHGNGDCVPIRTMVACQMFVQVIYGETALDIALWNDQDNRQAKHVIAMLEKAAMEDLDEPVLPFPIHTLSLPSIS